METTLTPLEFMRRSATRHPTQAWTAQQLRNATLDGDAPALLLRDRLERAKDSPSFIRKPPGAPPA